MVILQDFLKNKVTNLINFYYNFDKYDMKKIQTTVDKLRQNEKMADIPMKQVIYCLKLLFDDCAKKGFQVSGDHVFSYYLMQKNAVQHYSSELNLPSMMPIINIHVECT